MSFSSSLSGHFTEWWRKAAFFSKAAIFISGLIGVHGLVEYALLATFKTQLTEDIVLPMAAITVNLFEGLSSLFVIVVSQLSESYFGRFKVILFTNAAFILGLGMLWYSFEYHNVPVVFVALVALTFGKAGRDITLKAFLADQLCSRKDQEANLRRDEQHPQSDCMTRKISPGRIKDDFEEEKKAIEARREFYWSVNWIFGVILATLWLSFEGWSRIIEISTIAVAAGFSLFLLGMPFYERKRPSPSPLRYIFKVVKVALSKRHMDYPDFPSQLRANETSDTEIRPHIAFLRWLDKAAILEAPTTEQLAETAKEVFEVKKVKDVKRLMSMSLLWSTFYVSSLVGATANTFFYKQADQMNGHLGKISNVPIVVFVIIMSSTSSITSIICSWFKNRSTDARRPPLNRIRFGMFFSIICCAVAYGVEVRRLHGVKVEDNQISVFWLTPQFFLVGLMEGLSESGLQDFFETQVCDSMKEYGPQFSEFSTGIGKCLTVICILVFLFWFDEDVNTSRLDKYYAMLTVPTFLNFVFCCFVSNWYANQGHDHGENNNVDQESQDGVADVIALEIEHGAVEDLTNVVSGWNRSTSN